MAARISPAGTSFWLWDSFSDIAALLTAPETEEVVSDVSDSPQESFNAPETLPLDSATVNGQNNIAPSSANEQPADKVSSVNVWTWLAGNLVYIWLVGIVFSFGWHILSYAIFCRRVLRSDRIPHEDDRRVFRQMCKDRNVRLVCSDQIDTPMLMGVFRPIIVLSGFAYAENGLDTELRNILRHELMHHRKRDTVYKWLIVLITGVHWFNPVVYCMSREISRACELSCDEAVIREMDATERKSYGNTLLTLAASKRRSPSVPATTMCEEKQQLKGRLIHIMNYQKKSKWAIVVMLALAVLLGGCAALMTTLTPTSETPASSAVTASYLDAYKSVLQGKSEFFSTDANKNLNVNQLKQAVSVDSSTSVELKKFAIVDLDNDGAPEIILELLVNDNNGAFEVLRYHDGMVYGYTEWYRGFRDLKVDGSFSYSDGVADNGFGTLEFTKNGHSRNQITYSESDHGDDIWIISYFVNHEKATEEEYRSAINKQSEKTDATWYDITDENVEALLSETATPTLLGSGEIIIENLSVTQATEKYGDYSSYETAYFPGNSSTYIRLIYDNIIIDLEDNSQKLSFAGVEDNGYDFGTSANPLTENDKIIGLTVSRILWTDDKITGPRGIKIGDSLDVVKSKFLDKSDQYNDGKTIYSVKDIPAKASLEDDGITGGHYNKSTNEGLNLDINPDHELFYYTGYPKCEFTCFYFENDRLIAIAQGTVNEP